MSLMCQFSVSRVLKRVPLDFNWPLKTVWSGYLMPKVGDLLKMEELRERIPALQQMDPEGDYCGQCQASGKPCSEEAPYCARFYPANERLWRREPPAGEGYQLWETCSEGSPISPVFPTLDELCDWAVENATIYGQIKTTKERWREVLTKPSTVID